jgi:hypothetical protein
MRTTPLRATVTAGVIAAAAALAIPGAAGAATVSARHAAAAPNTQVSGTLANGTQWIAEYPSNWNGDLILYSHGFGPLTAADAPDPGTAAALLAEGYAISGSSYDPNGSEWALDTAVSDQFGTLQAVEAAVLPGRPAHVIALGTSMGGLISALEAQDGRGAINGAVTTCGIVSGGINLNEFQLDGEYAIAQLLLPGQSVQLLNFTNDGQALGTAAQLTAAATAAQSTAAGRAKLALAMAFLNVTPWNGADPAPVPASDPDGQEAAQYSTQFTGAFSIMDFIELGRLSIDQADGGSANWNAGVNYASAFARSPFRAEVEALYQQAGLNLSSDLRTLTRNAAITASPAAVRSLYQTSVPAGRLAVPELDIHTIGDNLVPVEVESNYRHVVDRAGSGDLLRQAYTESFGHCNFSSAEIIAGVHAVLHRITTGHWGDAATTASLEAAAIALNLGPARFVSYRAGELTGQVPAPFPWGWNRR